MRMPVKLNKSFWPKLLTDLLPSANDPRRLCTGNIDGEDFSRATSTFKFGNTFKTTKHLRFPKTLQALKGMGFSNPPIILDVGASDGSTSLSVMESIDFKHYYLTDLNPEAFFQVHNGQSFFFDSNRDCILIVNKYFVIYTETQGALFPFGKFINILFSNRPIPEAKLKPIELINPEINKLHSKITVMKYNILHPWTETNVDVVLAANILNHSYFSVQQITSALMNFMNALNEGGRLVVVENRTDEQAAIYRLNQNQLFLEVEINGGVDIHDLVMDASAQLLRD